MADTPPPEYDFDTDEPFDEAPPPEREEAPNLRDRARALIESIRARVVEGYANLEELRERNPRMALLLEFVVLNTSFFTVRLIERFIQQAIRDRTSPNFQETEDEWAQRAEQMTETRLASFEETARSIHLPPPEEVGRFDPKKIEEAERGEEVILESLQSAEAAREAAYAAMDAAYMPAPPSPGDLYDRQAADRRAKAEADRGRREAKRRRGDVI